MGYRLTGDGTWTYTYDDEGELTMGLLETVDGIRQLPEDKP